MAAEDRECIIPRPAALGAPVVINGPFPVTREMAETVAHVLEVFAPVEEISIGDWRCRVRRVEPGELLHAEKEYIFHSWGDDQAIYEPLDGLADCPIPRPPQGAADAVTIESGRKLV